jgi:hypothetical protein
MASPAQITANRANAQLSTGPLSPEGKAASAANATTHGLASPHAVLPHEDPAGFAALHERFTAEFSPQTEHHRFLIRQMAEARWRLIRIQRLEAAVFDLMVESGEAGRSPDHRIAAAMLAGSGDAVSRLERYRTAAERSYFKAYKTLHDDRYYASVVDAEHYAARQVEKFAERIVNGPCPNQPGHPNYNRYQELEAEHQQARVQNEPNRPVGAAPAKMQNEPSRPASEPFKLSPERQRELALRL